MPPRRAQSSKKGKGKGNALLPGQTLLTFQPAPNPALTNPKPTLAERGFPTETITLKEIEIYYATEILGKMGCSPAHQQYLCIQEKILRNFDMQLKYGPCLGHTRYQRWNRAESLGLKPPREVLAIILAEEMRDGVGVGSDKGRDSRKSYFDTLLDIWGLLFYFYFYFFRYRI
ncbi:hypothetical protein L873DRAFT_7918 [Choiromyces venosus 120613-1]|uniref:DNA polymerase delta subunit 4 n=1 Tax=Choiromyces venosus 120613-1 TaxID=1336337 RepID=A0A3N4K5X9_9PEZI|nr:hypothetical protein L873DRAFT_7918 [Choiromyces venosus 120613-1]